MDALLRKVESLNRYIENERQKEIAIRSKWEPETKKFIKHARQNYYVRPDSPYVSNRLGSLPICPRCERTGLRHTRRDNTEAGRKMMVCPQCKYEGPYTTTVKEYCDQLLFR